MQNSPPAHISVLDAASGAALSGAVSAPHRKDPASSSELSFVDLPSTPACASEVGDELQAGAKSKLKPIRQPTGGARQRRMATAHLGPRPEVRFDSCAENFMVAMAR
jgi:hypothetical protein